MSERTPEPWRGEFTAFDEDWSHTQRRHLASTGGVRETYYSAGYRAGVNDANADLLAALEATLTSYLDFVDQESDDVARAVVEQARAAIAKATGSEASRVRD